MDEELKPKPKWAAVEIGYKTYVLPVADAVAVIGMMAQAEVFEDKYHTDSKSSTKHIYAVEDARFYIRVLTDDMYRMAKLAGKPE